MSIRPEVGPFQQLLQQHQGIVHKVVGLYARDLEDRRDLAQEIGLQAWRSFARYDPAKAKFSTWLYRVALNVAISQLRRRSGAAASAVESLQPYHLELLQAETAPEPDERVLALQMFIGQLDAFNRALILLYLEDRSYAEIADILGLSETNVATKIGRIKQTLRLQFTAADQAGA